MNNSLSHHGVVGMHWGRKKGNATSTKRTYINSQKLINGRTLSGDILKNVGTIAVTSTAGVLLAKSGRPVAGSLLAKYGSLYALGDSIGSVIVRTEKK